LCALDRYIGRLRFLLVAEAVVDFNAGDPSAVLPIVAAAKAEYATLGLRVMEGTLQVAVVRADLAPAIAAEAEQLEASPVAVVRSRRRFERHVGRLRGARHQQASEHSRTEQELRHELTPVLFSNRPHRPIG